MVNIMRKTRRGFKVSLLLDYSDTTRVHRDSYIYRVVTPTGVVFEGNQYRPSPLNYGDTGKILDGLIFFLCVRPGDTDQEYFKDYTPEQIEWANSWECEFISADLSTEDEEIN